MKQRLIIASTICLAFCLPACQPSGSVISNVVSPDPATASLSPEPSLTLTLQPTETATPSSSPTFTSTAISTVFPTSITMPRLQLVFASTNSFWILQPPAPPVVLSSTAELKPEYLFNLASDVIFSSDGKIVVFLIRGELIGTISGVYTMNSDGSGLRALLNQAQINQLESDYGDPDAVIEYMIWIPGTHRLLFSTEGGALGQMGLTTHKNLFELNADNGLVTRILKRDLGGYATPSPDGRKMAIINCPAISLKSIDGRSLYSKLITITPNPSCGAIVWKHNSSSFGTIIFSGNYSLWDPRKIGIGTIWSMDAATGAESILGTISEFSDGVLSPSLDRIGFTRPGKDISNDKTYVSTLDESISLLLATGPSRFISFSPDGQHFAYFIGEQKKKGLVYIGSLSGKMFLLPGVVYSGWIQWINNSQFVFIKGYSLQLGDIGGNFSLITTMTGPIGLFAAKDLDFQAGEK